jgi:Ca-activated chloride channel family protein
MTLGGFASPDQRFGYSSGGTATVNDEPYDLTFFKNYGVNPSIDTEDDHLSTFAMDVDTASYTVARRFLADGHLPDPDSVRVEEFINYFHQDYQPPADGAFAIHTEGAPSPFGGPNNWLMRVGLQGQIVSAEERKDASLVFVIDVSGSMAMDNRLGLVKRSLRLLVDELRPTDRIGIVVFGSRARVVLRPTSGENKGAILGAIEELAPDGSTNAEEGIKLGYLMAREDLSPERINGLILLSDGVANVGNTAAESILKSVRDNSADGVTLSTVGFGMGNFNDVLMEQLANDGDGTYAYVDTLNEARRIFVENLTGTLHLIARDAKVQVDFNPELVSRFRLLGYENRRVADRDFRNDAVDAGEVGSGHSVTALYELKLLPGAEGPLATVNVRYEDPDTGEVTEIARDFHRDQISATFESASPRFQLDAAVAEYAEILRESFWALEGDMEGVRAVAGRVSGFLPDDPDVTEFLYLVTQAALIAG